MKHTKGDWKIGKTGSDKTAIWVGGSRIAVIDEFPHEGSEHNAKLISESPKLLESLINVVYRFRPYATSLGDDIAINKAQELIDKIIK